MRNLVFTCVTLTMILMCRGENPGRQHSDVARYQLSDYLSQSLSRKKERAEMASSVSVNCGIFNRECLGGMCRFDYDTNGTLSNYTFERFPHFQNCIDPGDKTCFCAKRPWPTDNNIDGSAMSFVYDSILEIIVLDSSPYAIEVPTKDSTVEFYIVYTAPCCTTHEYQITYANRLPRQGKEENTLINRSIRNVSSDEVIKIFFTISPLRIDDSGTYTIQVFLNNSNLRIIHQFRLVVLELHLETPTIFDDLNKRYVDGLFLKKSHRYKFSCVAKGTVRLHDFEVYWKPCYKTVQCNWTKVGSDSLYTFTGAYQTEIDLVTRVEKSGTYKFKFDSNERDVSFFVSEISSETEKCCEITASDKLALDKTEIYLFCVYNPQVFEFIHWEIKNDNKLFWVITAETRNKSFSAHVNKTSENRAVAVLHNKQILLNDTGHYICHLKRLIVDQNNEDTFPTLDYYLKVHKPVAPFFNDNLVENVNINFTQTHVLNCSGQGVPQPEVLWLKNGRNLSETDLKEYWNSSQLQLRRVISANYSCVIANRYGKAMKVFMVTVNDSPSTANNTILYVGLIVLAILVLLLSMWIVFLWKRMNRKAQISQLYKNLMNSAKGILPPLDKSKPVNQQPESLPFDPSLEVERGRLVFDYQKILGEGQFGKVAEGLLASENNAYAYQVAIKTPKDGTNPMHMNALLSELKIMSHIGKHVNILGVLGVVTKRMTKGELFLILELCKYGSLQTYIQRVRKSGGFVNELAPDDSDGYVRSRRFLTLQSQQSSTPTYVNATVPLLSKDNHANGDPNILSTSDLAKFSYQVANGMEYLSSKNLVHRDLALRNILLTDRLVVKIADFGLALHEEFNPKKNKPEQLPLKWMALESISHDEFSSMSDVWSFGIVLYEMFSLGETPYANHAPDQNFIHWLKIGNRLEPPSFAPTIIATIMKQCWDEDPALRPNFQEIKILVEQLLREQFPIAHENLLELLNPANYYINFQSIGSNSLSSFNENSLSSLTLPPMDNPNYLLSPTSDKSMSNPGYLNQKTPLATVEEDDDEVFFPQKSVAETNC